MTIAATPTVQIDNDRVRVTFEAMAGFPRTQEGLGGQIFHLRLRTAGETINVTKHRCVIVFVHFPEPGRIDDG